MEKKRIRRKRHLIKPKFQLKHAGFNLIAGFALLMVSCGIAFAHTPYLIISDNEDGTVDIAGGYSTGQSAEGTSILLKSKKTGKILWQGRLDSYGELTITKQQEPYIIVFDGGPGHILKKEGPCLTKEEIELQKSRKKTARIQDVRAIDAETAAKLETEGGEKPGALTVTPVTQIYPLQDDFECVQNILPAPLMIQDSNSVIRTVPIMQGYRYHHGSGLEKLLKKVDVKRREGVQVDFAINDVGLCFGVTSGYLSLKFAISELYGKAIPKAGDFKIMAKGKMCRGVLDMYSIYFGRKVEDQNIQGSAQKGLTFTAERPSTGEKIVFEYNLKAFPELNRLFLVKNNPEKFKNVDFGSLKREVIKKLFSISDFSYFLETT